ncbi:hypothetical protein [Silvibacterium acidisoli]|uniref:hypothetical protein n=1 Tax=Acidobacteriaceae bacterium ZG23-2 TaxID=2883246 RepID=UPI00406D15DA
MAFLRQVAAVAQVRRSMLIHSFRTRQGRFDFGARILTGTFFFVLWLLASFGEGFFAAQLARSGKWQLLPLLLWPVMAVWQLMPVFLSPKGSQGFSIFLRFPVSFSSYFGLHLVFGFFELSTLLGGCMLTGIWTGLVVVRPGLALPAAVVLALFGFMNFVLSRAIFAWLERWLAQRRTREVLGTLTLFCFLAVQFLNPVLRNSSSWIQSAAPRMERWFLLLQKPLPPGLAASAVQLAAQGKWTAAIAPAVGVAAFLLVFALLLALRLRGEYRGETTAESAGGRAALRPRRTPTRFSTVSMRNSTPLAAIFEKEWLYLRRSGVLLYSLAAPPFLVLFFLSSHATGAQVATYRGFALPMGAAYAFLGLTRMIYNSLGGEGAGLRLYFLSPTPMRTVLLGKNLFQAALFLAEMALIAAMICFRMGRPDPVVAAVTFCWLLFALPLQLAMGNILSVTMGYGMNLTRLSSERGAGGNGLLGILIQLVIVGLGALAYLPFLFRGDPAYAVPILLGLACMSTWFWWSGLRRLDRVALSRREQLIESVARAA